MAVEADRWGIIYNPRAGIRKAKKRWRKMMEYLNECHVKYDYLQSESSKSIERLATMLANNGYRTIVVVGGDGALNDAVNGILHSNAQNKNEIALGVIPNGIGNDYASYWNITFDDYKKAIDCIIRHRTRRVDVGVCSFFDGENHINRYFLNAVHIGLGSRIVQISDQTYRFWGTRNLSLIASLFLLLFERKLYRVHLRVNDEHIRGRVMAICIGSARGYGLTPNAVPYNGWLDVSVILRPELRQLFYGMWMMLRGRILNSKILKPYRTKRVLVLRARNAQSSADGRLLPPYYPLKISILEEAASFIIP